MVKSQKGRSMVEMLAVLSIVGILSVGGVAGFSLAQQRLRADSILDNAIRLSSLGVGGRSFSSLASAGITKLYNVDMSIDNSGVVCIFSFPNTTDAEQNFFKLFKRVAQDYIVPNTTGRDCDLALRISNEPS